MAGFEVDAEAEVDLVVVVQVSEVDAEETGAGATCRCIEQLAPSAISLAKFLFAQPAKDRCIAVIVLEKAKEENQERALQETHLCQESLSLR